ncbi:unnamed protein product [Owenia fusiformis]|uniref:WSC domain-containing protein n=1 Tax=Owenia fusiformis TaxID=6347 RepID=A0A8S4NI70_OWEFU|nr:unnamed protein product [Owenia fusiformis]
MQMELKMNRGTFLQLLLIAITVSYSVIHGRIYNDHTYLGCFQDNAGNRDLGLRISNKNNRWDCIVACKGQGYRYSGMQYGNECRCGHSYGKHGKLDESSCNMMCTGEGATQTCGSGLKNNVYDTGFRFEEDRVSADVGKLSSRASVECSGSNATWSCDNAIDGRLHYTSDDMWKAYSDSNSSNNVGGWINITLARPYWIKEVSLIQNRESILTQASQVMIEMSEGTTVKMDLYNLPESDRRSFKLSILAKCNIDYMLLLYFVPYIPCFSI